MYPRNGTDKGLDTGLPLGETASCQCAHWQLQPKVESTASSGLKLPTARELQLAEHAPARH